MGFIDNSTDPKLPVFYNLVDAVGKDCPNASYDVELVQYLLTAFYDKALTHSGVYTRPDEEMTPGVCGPVTNNWIIRFQLDVNSRYPGKLAADNCIERVRSKDLRVTSTGTIYTLAVLNRFVLQVNPEAFIRLPQLIPLQSLAEVEPPTWETVWESSAAPSSASVTVPAF